MSILHDRYAGEDPDTYISKYGHPPLNNPKRVAIGQEVWLVLSRARKVIKAVTSRWNGYWVECVSDEPITEDTRFRQFLVEHFDTAYIERPSSSIGRDGAFSTREAAEKELAEALAEQARELRQDIAHREHYLSRAKQDLLELERIIASLQSPAP